MHLDENRNHLFNVLESLPDFQISMDFDCESSIIPFLKAFTPNDTFKISKQNSSIRLDFRTRFV